MLDGMFSFVLLDTRDNSFIVARDAIGITSLYIGWSLDGNINFFFNPCFCCSYSSWFCLEYVCYDKWYIYIFVQNPGSIWIASELKGLNDDCEHFESFPPGHLYSSKTGGLKRWYNPPWFSETIPSMPYDPLVLRSAFESVNFIPCKLIEIRVYFVKLLPKIHIKHRICKYSLCVECNTCRLWSKGWWLMCLLEFFYLEA